MADYIFKTIYFPGDRVRAGASARITISIPVSPTHSGYDETFVRYMNSLSSRDFRIAMGDPYLEDLERLAQDEERSVSNVCTRLLRKQYDAITLGKSDDVGKGQLPLPLCQQSRRHSMQTAEPKADLGVTFRDSLRQHVFGWYPYVEGFSATYTRDAILRYHPRTVYDPFGGSGTTQLAASILGKPSFYSEVNPFMAFVAEAKVNGSRWAVQNPIQFASLVDLYLTRLRSTQFAELATAVDLAPYHGAFPGRDFFAEPDLRELLAARDLARTVSAEFGAEAQALLLLACAANAVRSSNMTRRADLRRRRTGEYKTRVVDVRKYISESVKRMAADVANLPLKMAEATKISSDCRQIPSGYRSAFDLVLTSPPYLNGTNYFRNTKIELWLLDFIGSEDDLASLRRSAICAGINNVSRKRSEYEQFDYVEDVASQLDAQAKDRRIPLLVRHYFSDMKQVFSGVLHSLTPDGTLLLDIGDSKFYGVHVPTDKILIDIACAVGFSVEQRHVLARRHSRDKTELVQVELVMRRRSAPTRHVVRGSGTSETGGSDDLPLEASIARFRASLPYKEKPFSKRNWGHPLHSLCSYQGKLKPAQAHWLVRQFVPEGGRVLDPLGGVGTIPFEAAALGLDAVSNDKSPFASLVAAAKLAPPTRKEAEMAIQRLADRMGATTLDEADWHAADFGLNGSVREFFHEDTLHEVLRARRVFIDTAPNGPGADTFVWASLLHVLHGNRPYALSRMSHPITPFHPKGPFEYRSVLDKVRQRVERALKPDLPAQFRPGLGIRGDFRDLSPGALGQFDAIITSPPFLGMRFDRPNWLRLWFCGWGEEDFHHTSLDFLERQQRHTRDCYADFFASCRQLIADSGVLIMHAGSGGRGDLVGDLKCLADDHFSLAGEIVENVQAVEQHGIRDKGRTKSHHLLFFTPR